ncbi:MAG: T9SS type A sorting domain-containing protein [Bacteroidetes bacterium]|nr:T9SS type A sorting domain-containing protein [Bacteroidota bacterium]MDA0859990.1 T9SS type A sorting domain-containing protein [Bacteroidota bacterium]MDA1318087.1 T9SS type A sorting domain-containing protein [Bacteroidota bacterium]
MKKLYIFIIAIFSSVVLQAQITANFSASEGYENGALGNNLNWDNGSSSWFVNTTNEKVSTSANSAEALWTEQLTSISGSTVSFEVNFNFNGDFLHSGNALMAQIGFYNQYWISSGASYRDFVYLTFNSSNGKLKILKKNGLDFAITTKAISDWIDNDLTVKVSLTIGTSAATSYLSARLINNTTSESTDIGTYGNGIAPEIKQEIYAYANNGNVRGFFRTVTLQDGDGNNTEFMGVSSVSLSNGSTLGTSELNLSEFMLSQNPVDDRLELSGLNLGTTLSIYNLTGAKVDSYVYDGSPLSLGHLNSGVYFMEIPGYTVKKLIKK